MNYELSLQNQVISRAKYILSHLVILSVVFIRKIMYFSILTSNALLLEESGENYKKEIIKDNTSDYCWQRSMLFINNV